jgi:beta-galactosidase
VLELGEVRDRAIVRLNGVTLGVLARDHHDRRIALPAGARGTLDILVEDQGRVDYGPRIGEPKGLIGPACLNGEQLRRWTVLPLPLDDLAAVTGALEATAASVTGPLAGALAGPAFGYATFDVDPGADLYLDTRDWGKGAVWVNGFNLGRYWSRGPQHTLIVPAPILRPTGNTLVVLELHAAAATATFVASPDLGHTDF